MAAERPPRSRLLTRHTLHYASLGLAGLVFLGSGLSTLFQEGLAVGPAASAAGGLVVLAASGYALARPDASETEVGGWVWFSVLGALLVVLGVTVTA
jgi:hypothetical protein